MRLPVPHIRAGLFGIIILFFFLPFIVVSCPGYGQAQVSGIQLAVGTGIRGSQLSTVTSDQYIPPQEFAIVAMISAIVGIAFSYLKKKPAAILCALAAVSGSVFMFLLKGKIEIEAAKKAADQLVVRFLPAFWLALIGFIVVLGVVIALLGPVSGAHFNPVVSFVFALRRTLPWREAGAFDGAGRQKKPAGCRALSPQAGADQGNRGPLCPDDRTAEPVEGFKKRIRAGSRRKSQ